MNNRQSNPCYRCGKERTVVKTWKEESGISDVTITQTVCPDPACQKIIVNELKTQDKKKQLLAQRKEERLSLRKTRRLNNISHN